VRVRALAGPVLVALLLWLVVYPLALVLVEAVRGDGGWTLRYVREFLDRPTEWKALWGSLWISLASVALSAAVGIPLGFLFSRFDFPGRRVLGTVVALPAVLPPLVGVLAFLFLLGSFSKPRYEIPPKEFARLSSFTRSKFCSIQRKN
jgi:iron(III) transport system permease protein